MVKYDVEILGDTILEKDACYEAPSTFQSKIAIITVSEEVALEFQRKYRMPMTSVGRMIARVELTLNEENKNEPKYSTKRLPYFVGFVKSIDDITLPNRI
ncbi:hypothetical protein J4423_01060 [Candidatus Pacearchaeota archaeon]|nr:hypothetical protein [Candidatus Pacearchaeota archaeon]